MSHCREKAHYSEVKLHQQLRMVRVKDKICWRQVGQMGLRKRPNKGFFTGFIVQNWKFGKLML